MRLARQRQEADEDVGGGQEAGQRGLAGMNGHSVDRLRRARPAGNGIACLDEEACGLPAEGAEPEDADTHLRGGLLLEALPVAPPGIGDDLVEAAMEVERAPEHELGHGRAKGRVDDAADGQGGQGRIRHQRIDARADGVDEPQLRHRGQDALRRLPAHGDLGLLRRRGRPLRQVDVGNGSFELSREEGQRLPVIHQRDPYLLHCHSRAVPAWISRINRHAALIRTSRLTISLPWRCSA